MKTSKDENVADIMFAREGMYAFLSHVFLTELDRKYVTTLLQNNALADKRDKEGNAYYVKGLAILKEAVNSWHNEDVDKVVDKTRKAFAHLFLVKNEGAVHPYESVYLGKEKLLMQEPYERVRAFYEEAGIIRSESAQEIEDHVGLECEFMAMLCEMSLEAIKKNDFQEFEQSITLQRSFLVEHLGRWVPVLCDDMLKRTLSPFYRGIAYLIKGFIDMEIGECERLDSMSRG